MLLRVCRSTWLSRRHRCDDTCACTRVIPCKRIPRNRLSEKPARACVAAWATKVSDANFESGYLHPVVCIVMIGTAPALKPPGKTISMLRMFGEVASRGSALRRALKARIVLRRTDWGDILFVPNYKMVVTLHVYNIILLTCLPKCHALHVPALLMHVGFTSSWRHPCW
jgi:hypothetical protein